jgi:hypothetical protein
MTQAARLQSLEKFRKGEVAFLLATDVAARGLDILGLQVCVFWVGELLCVCVWGGGGSLILQPPETLGKGFFGYVWWPRVSVRGGGASRLRSLERFRKGEVAVLLATDVAARGLDILGLQVRLHLGACLLRVMQLAVLLPAAADGYCHFYCYCYCHMLTEDMNTPFGAEL